MPKTKKDSLEYKFESSLWKSRLITLFAVIFSLFSALSLFVAGSYQSVEGVIKFIQSLPDKPNYNYLVINIISAIDLYLIGIVLMIFSFGIYELFISKIDPAQQDKEINILEIKSLDALKNKLLKVIMMVLIVHFFKLILSTHFTRSIDILYLGIAILAVSASTFFIRKIEN